MKSQWRIFLVVGWIHCLGISGAVSQDSGVLRNIEWERIEILWYSEGDPRNDYSEVFSLIDKNTGEAVIPELRIRYHTETVCFCGETIWRSLDSPQFNQLPCLSEAIDLSDYFQGNVELPLQAKDIQQVAAGNGR
jgi:hypothetical protein